VRTGQWSDFATGARGTDLVALYAAIYDIDQVAAAKKLVGEPYSNGAAAVTENIKRAPKKPQKLKPEIKLVPIPKGTKVPNMNHSLHGKPSKYWKYTDSEGTTLFLVARYDTKNGEKEIVPWSYTGKTWVKKSWPKPRPLYNLHQLSSHPTMPVLIVEGEKAADAAKKLTKAYIVTTWPNGGNSWGKTDLTPLYGRKVLLWPDADSKTADTPTQAKEAGVKVGELLPYEFQPGVKVMNNIGKELCNWCSDVKILNVQDLSKGYDAADLPLAFSFYKWAKARVMLAQPALEPTVVIESPAPPPEPAPTTIINNIIATTDGELPLIDGPAIPSLEKLYEDCGLSSY